MRITPNGHAGGRRSKLRKPDICSIGESRWLEHPPTCRCSDRAAPAASRRAAPGAASESRRPPPRVDLLAGDAIAAHLLEEARPQSAPARPPLAAAVGIPGVPAQRRPRPAPVALVRLQVREPAEGGMGMRLVREQERPFVAAPAIVAVMQARKPQRMHPPPEVGARMLDLGLAGRDRPRAPLAVGRVWTR